MTANTKAPTRTVLMFAAGLLIAAGMQVTGVPSAHAVCGLEDEYTFPITPGWGLEEGYGDPQCGAFGTVYRLYALKRGGR